MTKQEIKDKIDYNNKLIKEKLKPNIFVLNDTIEKTLKENDKLQKLCETDGHLYDNGRCIYCYKEAPTNE